jgi:hypothetical protein
MFPGSEQAARSNHRNNQDHRSNSAIQHGHSTPA